jgi:hypothetical protein
LIFHLQTLSIAGCGQYLDENSQYFVVNRMLTTGMKVVLHPNIEKVSLII